MHVRHAKELLESGLGKAGLALLALFLAMGVACPLFCRDPRVQTAHTLRPPSSEHLLGTNDVGQDVWARLANGARTSMVVAVGAGLLSTAIAALVGVSSGLAGGLYDRAIMRLVDALLVMPSLIVLILLAAFVQPGLWGLTLLIGVLHWQGGARVVRAQTLSLKERSHVLASRTFGAGRVYIALRHVIPELSPLLAASFIHRARTAVFMEAGLAFIGISDPSTVSWGAMIRNALNFYYLPAWRWWLLPAGVCLSLLILSFAFLGHSLERAMAPRLRDA